jgi:pyridoxine 5'-phosphate synthase PdxJ
MLNPLEEKIIRNNDIENIGQLIQVRMNLSYSSVLEVMALCDGDAK